MADSSAPSKPLATGAPSSSISSDNDDSGWQKKPPYQLGENTHHNTEEGAKADGEGAEGEPASQKGGA